MEDMTVWIKDLILRLYYKAVIIYIFCFLDIKINMYTWLLRGAWSFMLYTREQELFITTLLYMYKDVGMYNTNGMYNINVLGMYNIKIKKLWQKTLSERYVILYQVSWKHNEFNWELKNFTLVKAKCYLS